MQGVARIIRALVFVAMALTAVPSHALDAFPNAKAVSFDGRRLLQAAQGQTPVERWREFIPEGEKIPRWTHGDPKALAAEVVRALKREYPQAPSSLFENPKTGEVLVDFIVWPKDHAFTEFNVFRYGKRDGGGLVAQQYAMRVYGDAGDFLRKLRDERPRLLDAMAKTGLTAAR